MANFNLSAKPFRTILKISGEPQAGFTFRQSRKKPMQLKRSLVVNSVIARDTLRLAYPRHTDAPERSAIELEVLA